MTAPIPDGWCLGSICPIWEEDRKKANSKLSIIRLLVISPVETYNEQIEKYLLGHTESFHLLTRCLTGFHLTKQWFTELINHGETVSLDLPTAFYPVYQKGLCFQISVYESHILIVKWVRAHYLNHRFEVRVNGLVSDYWSIKCVAWI